MKAKRFNDYYAVLLTTLMTAYLIGIGVAVVLKLATIESLMVIGSPMLLILDRLVNFYFRKSPDDKPPVVPPA